MTIDAADVLGIAQDVEALAALIVSRSVETPVQKPAERLRRSTPVLDG